MALWGSKDLPKCAKLGGGKGDKHGSWEPHFKMFPPVTGGRDALANISRLYLHCIQWDSWPTDHLECLFHASQFCEIFYKPIHLFWANQSRVKAYVLNTSEYHTHALQNKELEGQRKPGVCGSQRGPWWLCLSDRWALTDCLRAPGMGERHSWNKNSWFMFSKSITKGEIRNYCKDRLWLQPAGMRQAAGSLWGAVLDFSQVINWALTTNAKGTPHRLVEPRAHES